MVPYLDLGLPFRITDVRSGAQSETLGETYPGGGTTSIWDRH